MAKRNVTIEHLILRNDVAENWTSKNPVLLGGELGIESDTRRHKFGDGVTAWNDLKYAGGSVVAGTTSPKTTDLKYDVGTLWVNTTDRKVFILFAASETAATWVELPTASGTVESAKKLAEGRTFTFEGDIVTTSKTFDGSGDVSFNIVLKASGAKVGTYTKLTINDKGIVTSATNLSAADIPELTLSKISDAGTVAAKDFGTEAGNVPILDASGKLDSKVMPDLSITDVYTVDNQEAMLKLTAQRGDVAIVTDESASYILSADTPSVLSAWKLIKTPDCKVLSVNGKTGAVTLDTDSINEGSKNLYFTEARATANFDKNIAAANVSDLADGSKVLMSDDTFTIDGGKA